MYENVETLKNDLKRFSFPLKGRKELEALLPTLKIVKLFYVLMDKGHLIKIKLAGFFLQI